MLLVLFSGAALACAPVMAKLAYRDDVRVATLLTLRFCVASTLFWILVTLARRPLPDRRGAIRGLVYGAVFYAIQALLLFSAVRAIDASVAIVLFYVFPALIVVVSVATGRERFSRARSGAVAVALAGVALVALGGGVGSVRAGGIALALCGAVAYVAFVLAGDALVADLDPIVLGALLATGAIPTFVVYGLVSDGLSTSFQPGGWGWIVGVGMISLLAFTTFFAGLRRVGPSLTGLLSTVEPVVAAGLSVVLFDERLAAAQIVGAALVIGAVVAINLWELRRAAAVASLPRDTAPRPSDGTG